MGRRGVELVQILLLLRLLLLLLLAMISIIHRSFFTLSESGQPRPTSHSATHYSGVRLLPLRSHFVTCNINPGPFCPSNHDTASIYKPIKPSSALGGYVYCYNKYNVSTSIAITRDVEENSMKLNRNSYRGALYHCGQIRSTGEVDANSEFQRPTKQTVVRGPAPKELDRVFYMDFAVSWP